MTFPSVCDGLWSDERSIPRSRQALRDDRSYVYFIGGEGTPVKIGLSTCPYERLAHLQTAHWIELRILALIEGGLGVEQYYHRRWSRHRLLGEWFERAPAIQKEIARIASLHPLPAHTSRYNGVLAPLPTGTAMGGVP